MIRTFNIVMMITSVIGLTGVYGLKYSVEETASRKAGLERSIERQEGDLSLLQADWAYLNQPAHVGPIVARHAEVLGLAPLKQEQFGSLEGLPMRLEAPDDTGLDALFESLEAGVDPADQPLEQR